MRIISWLSICYIVSRATPTAMRIEVPAKGKRFTLPHARVLIHQPSLGGLSGQATDIDIQAREILRMREITNNILVRHTGQPVERIQKDVERDYIMTADQAKEYGVIDQIIHKHI